MPSKCHVSECHWPTERQKDRDSERCPGTRCSQNKRWGNVCLEKTKQNAFVHLNVFVLLLHSECCDILPVLDVSSETSG